jgi:hypothetical protein
MRTALLLGILAVALLPGVLAAPGEILWQPTTTGPPGDDWVNNITNYQTDGELLIPLAAIGNSYNQSNSNWGGLVLNMTFTLEDTGQVWSGSGDTFRVGLSSDGTPSCGNGDFGFDYNGANGGDASYRFVRCDTGYTDIVARSNGNHTFWFIVDTTTNTSNVDIWVDGSELVSDLDVNIYGGIRATWIGKLGVIAEDQGLYDLKVCEEYCDETPTDTITFTAQNIVNLTSLNTFCVDYTGNGTGTNCTESGSLTFGGVTGLLTFNVYNVTGYYNQSFTTQASSTGTNLKANLTQGYTVLDAYKLFLNTSILSFTATNNKASNTTTNASLLLPVNTGTNLVSVSVPGNYTLNTTCTGTSTSITTCNVTGVYDTMYNITATQSGSPVSNFTIQALNQTISASTTNFTSGTIATLFLIQPYTYNITFTSNNHATQSAVLAANASTQTYNFNVLTTNTFNLTFIDEITQALVTDNVTLEVFSDDYSNNYTVLTNGSSFEISLLQPAQYTLRYRSANYNERDYIITLVNGTYNNIDLYMINISESSDVTVTVEATSGERVENATVKLLRYFVSCNCYRIVEMGKTSSAGQSIFWVQALEGYYKWSIEYQGTTEFLSTEPENINTDTRTFTINLGSDYYESYEAITSVTRVVSYNKASGALSFTWNDPSGIVTRACLDATFVNGTRWDTVGENCNTGSAGSVILMLDNETTYKYVATLTTSTQYSDYTQSGWLDKASLDYDFGQVGSLLSGGIIIGIAMIFSFSAVAVVIAVSFSLLVVTLLGIMKFSAVFVVSFTAVAIGLSLYLMRR